MRTARDLEVSITGGHASWPLPYIWFQDEADAVVYSMNPPMSRQ